MSWRNQQNLTGTNDTPLQNPRRFGAAASQTPEPEKSATPDPDAPRKRKSRWGEAKPVLAGVSAMPTAIDVQGMSVKDLSNYTINLRIDEVNRKLRLNDVVPPERERSPSPPPTYDAHGRRTNTRDIRYRKKLENERIALVEQAMKNDPNFQPPAEYHQQKRSHRPQDKVYIPVKEFPEINFFGLLVGPRGNSLKKMERESGAKISIRGKGSVKEGKGRPDAFADDAEEDLHCLVMADTQEKVASCVALINRVIETAASTPEGENDHKRNQLRELAALNGTLRDDENQICQNCGERGHRKYDCPQQRNFSAGIICRICGSAGHMARDCTSKRDPNGFVQPGMGGPHGGPGNGAMVAGGGPGGFDSDYANLMAELGEVGAATGGTAAAAAAGGGTPGGGPAFNGPGPRPPPVIGGQLGPNGQKIPPWRLPEMWNPPNPRPQGGMGGGGGPGMGGSYGGGGYGQQQGGYGQQHHQQQQGYGGAGYGAGAGYGGASGGYNPQQAYGQQQSPPNAQYGQQGFDQQAAYAQYYQSLQSAQ